MPFDIGGYIYNGGIADPQDYISVINRGILLNVDASAPSSYPGTGTAWSTLTTNSNNATLINGPTYSSNDGGSIAFDGTNDYATFSNSIIGASSDSFTISSFARVSSINTTTGNLAIGRGRDEVGAFAEGWSLALLFNTTGKPEMVVTTTSPSIASHRATGTTTVSANTWYYLTGVWTAGSNISIYLNGTLESSVSNTTTSLRTSTTGFVLASIGVSTFYPITIGNAQAYNRALSAAEILQNFNVLRGRFGI